MLSELCLKRASQNQSLQGSDSTAASYDNINALLTSEASSIPTEAYCLESSGTETVQHWIGAGKNH